MTELVCWLQFCQATCHDSWGSASIISASSACRPPVVLICHVFSLARRDINLGMLHGSSTMHLNECCAPGPGAVLALCRCTCTEGVPACAVTPVRLPLRLTHAVPRAACLGNAGNTYWLQNVEQLNVGCGFPPIPNADGSSGPAPAPVTPAPAAAAPPSSSGGGLTTSSGNAAAESPPYIATPAGSPIAGPTTQSTGADQGQST